MQGSVLMLGVIWYVVFVFSTVCHEFAHAWSANKLGDSTAYRYISLNPLPHIQRSPFGMVIIPLVTFIMSYNNGLPWMIGFASVPVSVNWALSSPRKYALSSLAGPLANIILSMIGLAAVIALVYFSGIDLSAESATGTEKIARSAYDFFHILFFLNLALAVFNLLPLPPMDGSHLPLLVMPREHVRPYMEIIWNNTASLIGVIIAWNIFSPIFARVYGGIMQVLVHFFA